MIFTGPVTIISLGPSAEDIAAIVADQLTAALTPIKESLMALNDDLAALRNELGQTFADLDAKIQRLQDAVDNPTTTSQLDADGQAILDEIKAQVAAARATVGDENSDGSPAAPATTETPVEG